MDKLMECAQAFERLLDIKYHIIAGRKGKLIDISILFEKKDFHHLTGLHKLKDVEALAAKRENVFDDIISGKITIETIEKSDMFRDIQTRMETLISLERLLDDNRIIFKYNQNKIKPPDYFSYIEADFLLVSPYNSNVAYVFLSSKIDLEGVLLENNPIDCFCRSFFLKEEKDYTIGQTSYTLLCKEKISISTGCAEAQYDRMS